MSDIATKHHPLSLIEEIETRIVKQFKKMVGYCSDGRVFEGLQPVYDHMYKGVNIKVKNKRKGRPSKKSPSKKIKTDSSSVISGNIDHTLEPQFEAWYSKAYDFWEDETKCPPNDGNTIQLRIFVISFRFCIHRWSHGRIR